MMVLNKESFYTDQEKEMAHQFLQDKYIIVPTEDMTVLDQMRRKVAGIVANTIGYKIINDDKIDSFLNNIHERLSVKALNDIRVKVIADMNCETWFRWAYFKVAHNSLITLVGNELAMQRRINLSIQFPYDDSSLLPVHADVWSGDSPYEIVLWIPLVNCYQTKSMYIANTEIDAKVQKDFGLFQNKSSEDLFQHIKDSVKFLDVPYGSLLLFSQNVMHGNRVNLEAETRWSMNCRFKSILTPYHGKKIGDFFEPITLRALTRLGLDYQLPEGLYEQQ